LLKLTDVIINHVSMQEAFFPAEDGVIHPRNRSSRHLVVTQVPDDNISALYPVDDNYVLVDGNRRSPKSLAELSIEALCRALPYLDGELPPGLPDDIVNDILKSLMQHSALNASTLRVLRNCEIGALSLAGCRGVSDEWLEPFSVMRTPRSSPQLSHLSPPDDDTMDCMDLGYVKRKSEDDMLENGSCSTASFVSASSTPIPALSPTRQGVVESSISSPTNVQSSLPVEDFMMHIPSFEELSPKPSLTSSLFLLDLRGSSVTDRGLMQLSNLGSLEVAK
jgi:hypothetical protein